MSTTNPGTPNPRNDNNSNVTTIDLAEVFGVLWHWIWLLLLVAFICGIAGYCFSRFVLPEEFESTTKIYILNKSDAAANGTINYSDVQAGSSLTKDYAELITSHDVLDMVIEDLQLPYSYDTLVDKITVTIPTDTRIVSITVTDTDPVQAQTLAIEVSKDASEHIKNVMDLDAVNIAERATLPTHKSAPSNSRWAVVSALIGFLIVAAVLIIQYLMDDTLRTPDDVIRYLEMSTLAQIPGDSGVINSDQDTTRGKKRKKNRRKKAGGESRGNAHRPGQSRVMTGQGRMSGAEREGASSASGASLTYKREGSDASNGAGHEEESGEDRSGVDIRREEKENLDKDNRGNIRDNREDKENANFRDEKDRTADSGSTGKDIRNAGGSSNDNTDPLREPGTYPDPDYDDNGHDIRPDGAGYNTEGYDTGSRKKKDNNIKRSGKSGRDVKRGTAGKSSGMEDIPDVSKKPEVETIDIDLPRPDAHNDDDRDENDKENRE